MSDVTDMDKHLEEEAERIEEMREHVRTYIGVFMALMVLTAVTVGVSYIDFSSAMAIAVALFIAIIKGSLVAGFFMHLIDEKKAILWLLILTAIFLVAIFVLPIGQHVDPGVNMNGAGD